MLLLDVLVLMGSVDWLFLLELGLHLHSISLGLSS